MNSPYNGMRSIGASVGRSGGGGGPRPPTDRYPLASTSQHVQPLTAIAEPRYQAYYTTYPARMRLGTSGMMQPLPESSSSASGKKRGAGSLIDGLDPGLAAMAPTGKRQRAQVNYAEIEGMQDAGGALGVQQRPQPHQSYQREHSLPLGGASPADDRTGGGNDGQQPERKAWGDGKSYLGSLPPGNLVVVQPVRTGRMHVFTEEELEAQEERRASFVPIQIDLDTDGFKIRDAFVWNAHEKMITPEAFARTFCDELDLPNTLVSEVAKQIKEQVQESTGVASLVLRSEEEEGECVEKDLRVVLNLDVQIGALHLVDKVDWDLSSSLTPELFASVLCRDLSLSSAAAPLICHAIHEELIRIKRHLVQMGIIPLQEPQEGKPQRGAKPLEGAWRDFYDHAAFGPRVQVLTLDQMDKRDEERERALRRSKKDKLSSRGARRR